MDAKEYPTRSVEEPDTSKVLRGSHDGFVESIMANAALLRRRIRDPALTLERHQVGGRSQTDVALVYMKGEANEQHLRQLRQKLDSIDVRSIAMSQESIAECIVPKQWWNPFPKIRYTERPDVATASVMEGSILLMIDNTPSVMLLPTTLFSFAEEINDYYFPPLIGTYLRISAAGGAVSDGVHHAAVVSAGEKRRRAAGRAGVPADRGRIFRAADRAAAAGGVHRGHSEAGVPEHAGRAEQLLQHDRAP